MDSDIVLFTMELKWLSMTVYLIITTYTTTIWIIYFEVRRTPVKWIAPRELDKILIYLICSKCIHILKSILFTVVQVSSAVNVTAKKR